MITKLDMVEEKREQALNRTTVHNQVIAKSYNERFQPRFFKVRDLILNKVLVQKPRLGSFDPK